MLPVEDRVEADEKEFEPVEKFDRVALRCVSWSGSAVGAVVSATALGLAGTGGAGGGWVPCEEEEDVPM